MTSAQNPRQQLSGNRFLILALSVVLLSCNAFRIMPVVEVNKPEDTTAVVPAQKDSEVVKVVTKPEKPKKKDVYETVEFFGEYYQVKTRKSEFKVALVLPFYTEGTGMLEKRTSDVMLDYYSGVLMALTSLQANGIKLKLYVYDNENDSVKLKKILGKREMSSMDFIVGPILESQMAIVSKFALKHDIGVFSPFSSIARLPAKNERFYSTAPNLKMKAKNIVKFLEEKYPDKKLVILRDGQPYEKQLVPILIEELDINGKISYLDQAYEPNLNWLELMADGDTTIVYLPTQQSVIVNSSLGKIYSTKRDAILIGEHSWADFEDNDYGFWTKLNVHLLATDFIDYQSEEVKEFRQLYRQDNRVDPSLYAYLGYDQFHFLGELLMAFGEHYNSFLNEKDFRYLGSSYNFTYENGFNQNSNLFILQFKNLKLEPIE
jgi:ABC-type branched-subunit amino acid transport system substrate-binding protein